MVFIETDIFTEDVMTLLHDDEYGEFQHFLSQNPDFGDVIPGTGGLRKIRWMLMDRGKRGGIRVIYYYLCRHDEIRLLLIYRKGRKDDLTSQERNALRTLNERW